MDFILDLQELDTPDAVLATDPPGGSTTASNASLLLPCSHSTISLLAC